MRRFLTQTGRVFGRSSGVFLASVLNISAFAEYFVVLGSYQDRNIAIVELQNLDQNRDSLLISVYEMPDSLYYRIMAGPFQTFSQAQKSGELWQNQRVADAWVIAMPMPPLKEPKPTHKDSQIQQKKVASLQQ